MAARPGPGAAVTARASVGAVMSEFESDCDGHTQPGDSDVERPLETTQGRSGGPPRQALWADPNGNAEVAGTEPRGVRETRTWEWLSTQRLRNLSETQEKQRREKLGNQLTEAGFDNVPDAKEEPKPRQEKI